MYKNINNDHDKHNEREVIMSTKFWETVKNNVSVYYAFVNISGVILCCNPNQTMQTYILDYI